MNQNVSGLVLDSDDQSNLESTALVILDLLQATPSNYFTDFTLHFNHLIS